MDFLLIELAERFLLEEQMTETKNDQQGATLELIGTMRSKVRSATFSRPYVESSGVFCRRVVERLQPFYDLLFFSRCRFLFALRRWNLKRSSIQWVLSIAIHHCITL